MASTSAAIQVHEFVRALSMAWKNLAAYPRTHPAVIASLDAAEKRLAELRGPAGEVTLGIGSDSLLYGSLIVDSAAAQKFAFALYARGVAILHFGTESTPAELETFLRLLASGTPGREKRPIWEEITAAGVVNINLEPVNYAAVQLSETLDEQPEAKPDESVWDAILRALLEGRRFSGGSETPAYVASVDELSRMLTEYVDAVEGAPPAFDAEATFGVRVTSREERMAAICSFIDTTFGERIRGSSSLGLQHSLEQAVQLLQALARPLRSAVLAGILRALAGEDRTAGTLREFSAELPSDEVLEALRYISSMGAISPHASMLLRSLTIPEAASSPQAGRPAPAAVADLVRFFGEDDVDRFNPPDHQDLLASVAVRIPEIHPDAASAIEELGNRTASVGNAAVLRQLATVLMDLIADLTPGRPFEGALGRLEQLFQQYVEAASYEEAFTLLEEVQATAAAGGNGDLIRAVGEMIANLGAGPALQALVESVHVSEPEKLPALQRIVVRLGTPAFRTLLAALADEGNLSRRRRLFDFIVSLGPDVVPAATGFLADSRWYVVRNMITLLRVIQDRTSLPEVRKLAMHPDLRVRMEAIKCLFALEGNVPEGLLEGLFADPDPKLAQSAIALVGTYRMKEGVEPLLRILKGNDFLDRARAIRLQALGSLGEIGDPRALSALGRFFGRSWLPWPSREERLAAWESLSHYPPQARRILVEKGLKSRDREVRAICARLGKE